MAWRGGTGQGGDPHGVEWVCRAGRGPTMALRGGNGHEGDRIIRPWGTYWAQDRVSRTLGYILGMG